MDLTKKRVQINNALFFRSSITGDTVDHPGFPHGHWVKSSRILEEAQQLDGTVFVETLNTIYHVLSWAEGEKSCVQ